MSWNNLHFINWWGGNIDGKEWFYNFFSYCINQYEINTNFPLYLTSIFGPIQRLNYLNNNGIKIFFYGENTKRETWNMHNEKNIYPHVDIICGFFEETNKSVRVPLWCWYIPFWKDGLFKPVNNINRKKEAIGIFHNPEKRFDFCQTILKMGIDVTTTLKDFGTNVIHIGPSINEKIDTIKNYKYNICPENSDTIGYTTEKIFQSFQAGCIPIYYPCNKIEDKIINNNSILFLNDNEDSIKEQINKFEVIDELQFTDIWLEDSYYHICMMYFNLWFKIWKIMKEKNYIIKRKLNLEEQEYIVSKIDKNEFEKICKEHYKKYNMLFTPRIIFLVQDENKNTDVGVKLDMEEYYDQIKN